ncbi:hypothetical protein [Hyunsoonleella ulvae]|nr:hypothetical protein [Hyunsoonleella ulvae]
MKQFLKVCFEYWPFPMTRAKTILKQEYDYTVDDKSSKTKEIKLNKT